MSLLLIVLLGGLIFYMIKAGNSFVTIKITHWLLVVYTSVLVLSTIAVAVLTEETISQAKGGQEVHDEGLSSLYTNLSKGQIDKADEYLIKEIKFDNYQNQTLTITASPDYGSQVFVEKKQGEDSTVELFLYGNELTVDGYDFSNIIKLPDIELAGHTLSIVPIRQNIDLSIATNSYPIRQFTGEFIQNHYFSSGESFIYLRVPRDLELNAENVYLEVVDK
ncbi:hypothetical protein SAMN05192533_110111 [Mesobacillus persicus]|uniref:Uncharacterized protein n=1 Tax=Mesobacillus persicus TaxID=930146 RepID=A0A1H8EUM3_9BACI|nr:hypothetical protein [Mesobacillus persicus]SEN23183.1 hypothetical protein SAMN05192533_110111 [Mesobacillus persicus]